MTKHMIDALQKIVSGLHLNPLLPEFFFSQGFGT